MKTEVQQHLEICNFASLSFLLPNYRNLTALEAFSLVLFPFGLSLPTCVRFPGPLCFVDLPNAHGLHTVYKMVFVSPMKNAATYQDTFQGPVFGTVQPIFYFI